MERAYLLWSYFTFFLDLLKRNGANAALHVKVVVDGDMYAVKYICHF